MSLFRMPGSCFCISGKEIFHLSDLIAGHRRTFLRYISKTERYHKKLFTRANKEGRELFLSGNRSETVVLQIIKKEIFSSLCWQTGFNGNSRIININGVNFSHFLF